MENVSVEYIDSQNQHLRELLHEHEKMDILRHEEERRALCIASHDIDRRLGEMNRFREQLTEERGLYVRRELHDGLESRMDNRLKLLEQSKSNMDGKLWMMGASISGIVILVNLILYYVSKR